MQKQTYYKIYSIALFTTILLFCIYIYLNEICNGTYWQMMQQSKSALTVEYCELDQASHFFRQTINTYSNLMYFFLGMIVVCIGIYDSKNEKYDFQNPIQQFSSISILFGFCLMYLCFGSSLFHASLTWFGQRLDMNATYSICITLIGISLYRLIVKENESKHLKKIFIYSIELLIIAFVQLHLIIPGTILLPILILLLVVLTIINYNRNKNNYNIQLAILSFLFVIGAFILRTLDVKKIGCDPTSFYQGHAIWHFFTGMSAFLLYSFYRTEKEYMHDNEL